jgi:MFS family permease
MATGLFVAWRVLRGGVGDVLHLASTRDDVHVVGEDFPQKGKTILSGRPMLLKMMALYALSQCAVGLLASTMLPYVKEQFQIEEADLPKMIAVPALFVAALAIPLGRVADSIGRPQAVWISYVLAVLGMLGVAGTSLMTPTTSLLSPQILLFGLGMLLLVGSYILGTPAWLGLTSVQVEDSRQAQALSLMQTSQGVGVVVGSALVAGIGHLLTTAETFGERVGDKIGGPVGNAILRGNEKFADKTHNLVSIDMWFWVAAGIFGLCLLGTLLWVREPPHHEHEAKANEQPLEITGV